MRRRARLAGLTCLALLTIVSAGCSRSYWRRNADAEAYGLIREKSKLDARWAPPRSDIIPSPLSRLYDPADPDFGPLPPDDPAAHRYMHAMSDCDRIHGSDYWYEIGIGNTIENPAWVASLPIEGQPGPLLAEAFRSRGVAGTPANPAANEPLPFFERFAVTESLRSLKLPTLFGGPEAEPGRASIATAEVPTTSHVAKAPAKPVAGFAAAPKPTAQSAAAPKRTAKTGRPETITLASFQEEAESAEPPAEDADPLKVPEPAGENPFDVPDDDLLPVPPAPPEPELPPGADLEFEPPRPGEPAGEESADDEGPPPDPGPDITVANPALPAVEQLTLEEAIRLSYLHGREYQTQLETVYLAALDLAFDRFQFDVRFLGIGGGRPSSNLNYSGTPGGTESLTATNRIGISRLLPAGGQWAVELANQTLWLFSDGPNESGTASTLSFSFIQPLLFAAGRKVVLEDLTQSERNLLYAVRDLARFRQEFFVGVVAQGGYLGLLETIQQISNQEYNIERLRDQIEISEADELRTDPLSRTQLQSQLLSQLNGLRNSRRALQDRLDQYKIQLGLPPDLSMTLDTTLLEPFQLISVEMLDLEQRAEDEFLELWSTIDPDNPGVDELLRVTEVLQALAEEIDATAVSGVREDFARVEKNLPRRLAALPEPVDENRRLIEENAADDAEFFQSAIEQFQQRLAQLDEVSEAIGTSETLQQRVVLYGQIDVLQEDLLRVVRNLQGLQIGLRTELIELNPFEMPMTTAVGYALTNRVDLMNQRALVTDARRRVEVAANALRAVLDVRVEGDISTPPIFQNDNPFDFRRTNSTYRAGIGFVAPLDQIAQRNAYRATQITYQRTRREYMLFEDQIKFAVRQSWRQLQVLKQNFEVTRLALRIAARQYDQAVEATANPEQQSGASAGLAGQRLIDALNRVLNSQNDLIGIWVDYESTRLNIYRDMGIMEIDERGLWVDPFYQNGLGLPDGDVEGPPGWPSLSDEPEGPSPQNDGPGVIPPAPAPTAGVQKKGEAPSGRGIASNPTRSASPAGSGVLPAAHTSPPEHPPQEAGHARTRQPSFSRRTNGHVDRTTAEPNQRPSGWRSSAAKK